MQKSKKIKWMDSLIDKICDSYTDAQFHGITSSHVPSKEGIIKIIKQLKQVIFPGYFAELPITKSNISYFVGDVLNDVMFSLTQDIYKAFMAMGQSDVNIKECETLSRKFLNKLPEIREVLKKDIEAALSGDPAAKSIPEIITSYPCMEVISVYRLAHELYLLEVPLIPRIMTEYSHSITGVDIHPGAKIGEYFFIDHGTGVVIGETSVIGNNVKIYQGVTLGALSFPKDKSGKIIRGLKRHPTIGDNVTIYANATILGGNTIIGNGAVIGGNTWITNSVEAGKKVVIEK